MSANGDCHVGFGQYEGRKVQKVPVVGHRTGSVRWAVLGPGVPIPGGSDRHFSVLCPYCRGQRWSHGGCTGLLLSRRRNGGGGWELHSQVAPLIPSWHMTFRREVCGVCWIQFLTHASLLQLLEIWGEKNNGEQHVLVLLCEHRWTEAWLAGGKVQESRGNSAACATVAAAGSIKFWKARGIVCVSRWAAQLWTFHPSR